MKNLVALLLLLPIISIAQLNENFSDGNLTQGTVWQGNNLDFVVNTNNQLQLNTSGEGNSYISTSIDGNMLFEWNIWVKLSFSPSDNNQALIYLTSDNPILTLPLSGYYIKLGESGSNDAIELYRQEQNDHVLVARGSDGLIKDASTVRIKITRDDGHWQIFADPTGNSNYFFEASGNDELWKDYSYFGLVCKYTSSNSTKFYFDDIYAGSLNIDNEPPILLQYRLSGPSGIDLYFNEPMQSLSCQQVSNYIVNNDFGVPLAAGIDHDDLSVVHLLFQNDFSEETNYELSISNLKDLADNIIKPVTISFAFHQLNSFDVVINEIMPDPNPVVGLPDCEYLELYNRTSHVISLHDWHLEIDDSKKAIPEIPIPPHGYHLLTNTGNDTLMKAYGSVSTIPGFSLNNTGTTLTLTDNNNAVIHSFTYNENWYHDLYKDNGGWAIEQIDPNNPCGSYENWSSSICKEGGTPGKINSVNATNPDSLNPCIEYIASADTASITIFFSEIMDTIDAANPNNYYADHGLGYPVKVQMNYPLYNAATLVFSSPLLVDTVYSLNISVQLKDCMGNTIKGTLIEYFGIAKEPNPTDIVINELLYDPRATGEEFVEIYNRSNKILELNDFWIAERDAVSGEITNPYPAAVKGRLFFPKEYIVLTKEPELVKSEYFTPNPWAFMKMESFPALSNAGGTIALLNTGMTIIDEFTYNEDLHFDLLNITKGVSLERIDYNKPTNETDNWHSAGQNVGFATPGYQNSQFILVDNTNNTITVEPQTFSPDNDGYNDFLSIICSFDQSGYVVSIKVFDSNGRFVRLLAGNYLAGTNNTFTWDGINSDGEKAPSGIYIINTEIFNLKGEAKQFKDVAVIAGY